MGRFISRKSTPGKGVTALYPTEITMIDPQTAGTLPNGITAYKNVLVVWDETYNPCVLDWLDSLEEDVIKNLVIVKEHAGAVDLRWVDDTSAGAYPPGYQFVFRGDSWTVRSSSVSEIWD